MIKKLGLNLLLPYKLLLYPLVVALASLVLIVFLIVPQLRVLLTGQEDLAKAQNRLRNLDVKARELTSLDSDDLNYQLKFALASLPIDKDSSLVVGVFKELTSQSQMNLISLHFSSPTSTQNEEPEGFIARAEVIGSASSLIKLINNIEKSTRVMRVKTVEISSSAEGTVDANITVLAYFAPPPKELEPVDAQLPKMSDKDKLILNNLLNQNAIKPFTQTINVPAGKSDPFQ